MLCPFANLMRSPSPQKGSMNFESFWTIFFSDSIKFPKSQVAFLEQNYPNYCLVMCHFKKKSLHDRAPRQCFSSLTLLCQGTSSIIQSRSFQTFLSFLVFSYRLYGRYVSTILLFIYRPFVLEKNGPDDFCILYISSKNLDRVFYQIYRSVRTSLYCRGICYGSNIF